MADIVRRRPLGLSRRFGWPLGRLFDEMLSDFGGNLDLPEAYVEGRFVPAIDISESEDAVTLTAEAPGMGKDDLEVSVDNGVLTLRGEKKEEETREGGNFHRVERRYGRFERHIQLPQSVEQSKIEATYTDGVLKLTMPKTETARARAIQIK